MPSSSAEASSLPPPLAAAAAAAASPAAAAAAAAEGGEALTAVVGAAHGEAVTMRCAETGCSYSCTHDWHMARHRKRKHSAPAKASAADDSSAVPPPQYVEAHGLRYTQPFVHQFIVPFKLKHEERRFTLAELLAYTLPVAGAGDDPQRHAEGGRSQEFWRAEVEAGRVEYRRRSRSRDDRPDWGAISPDHVMDASVRNGRLRITTHVHEQVVAAGCPTVLYEDDRMVVVEKPAGVPCIGGGAALSLCRANVLSMLPLLFPRLGSFPGQLAPAHRIDKPVSGVFILGRSQRGSWKLGAAMSSEGSGKRYLARVRGRFPGQEGQAVTVDAALRMTRLRGMNGRLAQCACTEAPSLHQGKEPQSEADAPTGLGDQDREASAGLGAAGSSASADDSDRSGTLKPASTTFRLLEYDKASDTSLVQAELHSGRRHQIRAHLAVLRHPIANDDLYCPGGIGWDACCPQSSSEATDQVDQNDDAEEADRPAVHSKSSLRSYPTDEKVAFVDDADCGYPLRKMFTDARVTWCPSCDWALAQLDAASTAPSNPALLGSTISHVETDTESTTRPVTTAGGRIWLHALEYQFELDGHRYRFQAGLPDFVWGVAVPNYDGMCGKAVSVS